MSNIEAPAAQGDNRLPALAAEIRRAHTDVQDAAKTAAQRAIDAGHALIEAKELVKHGEWLPWLREHCALTERTAQLYMQIVKKGATADVIAAVGLSAAGASLEVIYCDYDPFANCHEDTKRQWCLFALYLAKELGWYAEGAWQHLEWLLGGVGRQGKQAWETPGDWLGEKGARCRSAWRLPEPSASCVEGWDVFLKEHAHLTPEDVEKELTALYKQRGPMPALNGASRKRRRRKSATVADLEGRP